MKKKTLTVVLSADHGGFKYLAPIEKNLTAMGVKVQNLGPNQLDPNDDYPKYAFAVSQAVARALTADKRFGVLLCRSGAGMTIAANKVPGIRAMTATTARQVEHGREHDDINVLSLSADWLTLNQMWELIQVFLKTEFSNEKRHLRRMQQIADFENDLEEHS